MNQRTASPRDWLIRKGGYYYRQNRAGYTASAHEAGRYTEAEAKAEAAIDPSRIEAVHLIDVLELRPDDAVEAMALFEEYFVRNYPGPNTIISNPHWHAPKIFRAALYALKMAPPGSQSPPAPILTAIRAILDGIDRTETDEPGGWWETSAGAEFGSDKLRAIEALFAR